MGFGMVWSATTHRGCVRTANEDAILAGPRVFAVADGVGGAAGGRDASAATIAELARSDEAGELTVDALIDAIGAANRVIHEQKVSSGAGSTLAGVALCGSPDEQALVLFNIGDSRVYRMRDGALHQLSRDHSVVAELVRAGTITEDEALHHPERRVITRALGADVDADVDVEHLDLRVGDRFLVCSDGLTNEVPVADIETALADTSDVSDLVQGLLDRTLDAGARDNVSIVIADVVANGDEQLDAPTHRRSVLSKARRRRSGLRS
ncbi:MAG: protein phosphatase 2C domain-containing protein [Actinomycetota bacterium]